MATRRQTQQGRSGAILQPEREPLQEPAGEGGVREAEVPPPPPPLRTKPAASPEPAKPHTLAEPVTAGERQEDSGASPEASASIEFWQQPDDGWRWRWKSVDGRTVLVSHRSFDSMEDAAESARSSFPESAAPASGQHFDHRGAAAAMVVAAVVAGALRRWCRR